MSCRAAWISLRVASPWRTISSNLLAASWFSSSSFWRLALCSSKEDSSFGRESIRTSMSLAVLVISCENKTVWSEIENWLENHILRQSLQILPSFCCCCSCGVLLPNPGNCEGMATSCRTPRLFVKLSACYKDSIVYRESQQTKTSFFLTWFTASWSCVNLSAIILTWQEPLPQRYPGDVTNSGKATLSLKTFLTIPCRKIRNLEICQKKVKNLRALFTNLPLFTSGNQRIKLSIYKKASMFVIKRHF